MSFITSLLQLYGDGWREQSTPPQPGKLRIEALLGTGAIDSQAEARRVAIMELARYAFPPISRTVAVEPVGAFDTPWLSHRPGSRMTVGGSQDRVVSLSMQRDDDGRIAYAAELGAHVATPDERAANALKKMSNGTVGGVSRVAQPVSTSDAGPGVMVTPAGNNGGHYSGQVFLHTDPVGAGTVEWASLVDMTGLMTLTSDGKGGTLPPGAYLLVVHAYFSGQLDSSFSYSFFVYWGGPLVGPGSQTASHTFSTGSWTDTTSSVFVSTGAEVVGVGFYHSNSNPVHIQSSGALSTMSIIRLSS